MKVSTKILVLLERYLRLEAIDKLSVVTTSIVVAGVVFALGTSAIFFLSTALVEAISLMIGNVALAYLFVGLLLVLMIVVFLMNKKKWVEDKIVRNISESILSEPLITGDESDLLEEFEKGGKTNGRD